MTDDPNAPDTAKKEAEAAKLNAEAAKLNAEAAKLNAEAAKLNTEADKLETEKRKLTAEKLYLERPAWQRTEVLGLAGALLVAVIGLGGTIWTQSIRDETKKLEDQRVALKNQQTELEKARTKLQEEEKSLQPTINELTERKAQLAASLSDLADKGLVTDSQIATQKATLQQLTATLTKLRSDSEFWQVDTLVDRLKSHYHNSFQFSALENTLADLLEKASPADQRSWSDRVEKIAGDPSLSGRFRMVLNRVLWRGTRRVWFRHELVHFAQEHFFDLGVADIAASTENVNIFHVIILDELDPSDRRFLAESLWVFDLDEGTKIGKASSGRLTDFLELSQAAEIDSPQLFFGPLAELQHRLLDPKAADEDVTYLAEQIAKFSPQCLVLTWHFDAPSEHWKHLLRGIAQKAENRIYSAWDYKSGLPFVAIPARDADVASEQAWRRSNFNLVGFWVPIKYEPSKYDRLRRVVTGRTLRESDLAQ